MTLQTNTHVHVRASIDSRAARIARHARLLLWYRRCCAAAAAVTASSRMRSVAYWRCQTTHYRSFLRSRLQFVLRGPCAHIASMYVTSGCTAEQRGSSVRQRCLPISPYGQPSRSNRLIKRSSDCFRVHPAMVRRVETATARARVKQMDSTKQCRSMRGSNARPPPPPSSPPPNRTNVCWLSFRWHELLARAAPLNAQASYCCCSLVVHDAQTMLASPC